MKNNNYKNIEIELLVKLCISKDKQAEKELITRSLKFIKRTMSLYDSMQLTKIAKRILFKIYLLRF